MNPNQEDSLDNELEPGVYFIYWKSGGGSVAAVGYDVEGRYWYHPSNWVLEPSFDWSRIEKVELISTQKSELQKSGMAC